MGNIFTNKKKSQTLEDKALDAYVDKLMKEDNDRIPILSEKQERKIYRKLIKFANQHIKEVLESTSIEIMGQKFVVTLQEPKNNHPTNQTTQPPTDQSTEQNQEPEFIPDYFNEY